MSRISTAYHEAGHALVARSLGRRVDSVSVGLGGGVLRSEPLAPEATDEERERGLVVVLAGKAAEHYAPSGPDPKRNGDPWFTDGDYAAMDLIDESRDLPTDEDTIRHYTERLGEEAVERARELAVELVAREAAIGRLELLADELLWRGHLTGEDVERLLEAPTWRHGSFTPLP